MHFGTADENKLTFRSNFFSTHNVIILDQYITENSKTST